MQILHFEAKIVDSGKVKATFIGIFRTYYLVAPEYKIALKNVIFLFYLFLNYDVITHH